MALKFCGCGSIIKDDGTCSNRRCTVHSSSNKRRGWKVGNSFLDFAHPVTREEALALDTKLSNLFKKEFGEEYE